jgi:hypothetical protein
MTTLLVTLLFVGAAVLAVGSMILTWLGCRERMAANLAAVGAIAAERSFFVRLVPDGLEPAVPGRRALHRRSRLRARRDAIRVLAAPRAAA